MSQSLYPDPETREIFESFCLETRELLNSLSNDLVLLESSAVETAVLNRIFRGFHTIKGTASFLGLSDIITLTHSAEDLLNKLRRFETPVSPAVIDALFEVHDWIDFLVKNNENTAPGAALAETIERLDLLAQAEENTYSVVKPDLTAGFADSPLEEFIRDAPDELADFTEEELQKLDAAFAEVNKSFKSSTSLKETKESGQILSPLATHDATIRVDVNRIEQLIDLSTELVLERNRLEQLIGEVQSQLAGNEALSELLKTAQQLSRITSGLQSSVTKIRMTSIEKLYQKAPRIIRDLSREFNKEIRLVLKGEKTEVDRSILEEMADPLVHMLRNACDHGIELPEERERKGKPRYGTITLDTAYHGNRVVLRIEDDGAGLDPEKLKQKAIEKKIINSELAGEIPPEEVFQLIFAPGFSTASSVSSVSGRGVGMDVVCTNVEHLHGTIAIESEYGKGTAFIISLPSGIADTSF